MENENERLTSIILSLYTADFSHAYLCTDGSLFYLAH